MIKHSVAAYNAFEEHWKNSHSQIADESSIGWGERCWNAWLEFRDSHNIEDIPEVIRNRYMSNDTPASLHFDHVQDSGKRLVAENGGQRDTEDGKLDFTILPYEAICRVIQHYMNGAKKYDKDNWKLLGAPEYIERYKRSALRHLFQAINGKVDEDHLSAAVFNILSIIYFQETEKNA